MTKVKKSRNNLSSQDKHLHDFFVHAFEEVVLPALEIQQKTLQDYSKRFQEIDQHFEKIDQRFEKIERIINAHTSDLHRIETKLDAFIDRTDQLKLKIDEHEIRISGLETSKFTTS